MASMRQQAQRQENSETYKRASLRRYARLLHDELSRRYPRYDRVEKYQTEITRLKSQVCPEL